MKYLFLAVLLIIQNFIAAKESYISEYEQLLSSREDEDIVYFLERHDLLSEVDDAIKLASYYCRPTIVRYLIGNLSSPVKIKNGESSPLFVSLESGCSEVSWFLIGYLESKGKIRKDDWHLLLAAANGSDLKVIKYLINKGIDPLYEDLDGAVITCRLKYNSRRNEIEEYLKEKSLFIPCKEKDWSKEID
jgi:hypothetical protein